MLAKHVARCVLGAGAASFLAACTDSGPSASLDFARAKPEWLTGNAAAALRSDGRIALPPLVQAPREIPEETARAQAVAWARVMADAIGNLRPTLEQNHGSPINWTKLSACDRLYYVQSASASVPDSASPWIHNAFGPRWLVRLCDDPPNIPIILALAANSDLTLENGELRLPSFNSGSWFQTWAIARGDLPLPLEPEAAIGFAFRATGARVIEVPALIQRNVGDAPASIATPCAFWDIRLEYAVRGTGTLTGDQYETSQLRVGREACDNGDTALFVARTTQPDTARTIVTDFRRSDGSLRRDTIRVALRAPYRFEAFQIARP